VEGQNIAIEYRFAVGNMDLLPGLAAELVRLNVDIIFAATTPAARAAKRATASIPIVSPNMGDPVADGLVASLAHPGGNVTGSTFLGPELVPKRMELLKQALPNASRIALLWHPRAFGEQTMRDMLAQAEAAARSQGLQVQLLEVQRAGDFDRAFATIAQADALVIFPSVMLFVERERISKLAEKHRLPTISVAREYVEVGGLISYGPSIFDLFRRAAGYVDRILKGAKPADLPVEQPTRFELVINLKTAKALGITFPATLLALADQVIE
jgi:putative ABC transport system substrate-binding protein